MTTTLAAVDRRLEGGRILWKPWLLPNDQAREGFVREFSPSGAQVRISPSPATEDKGAWYEVAGLRCVEVLDERFDFEAVRKSEAERRRRPRIDGEEWKDGCP